MPDQTPAPSDDLSAAIAEYQKRWEKPDAAAKPDVPATVEKAAASASEQAPAGDAPVTEKPAETQAPVAEAAEDLSYTPEKYRDEFKALTPEARKWVKDATLMRGDYTKKTQGVAAERKALEEERERQKDLLSLATNILSDKEAVERLKALNEERERSATAETPKAPFSWTDALLEGKDEVIEQEITRRAEAIAAKKAAEVEARIAAEVKSRTGPNPLAVALIEAHGDNHDNVVLDAAFKAMTADLTGAVDITPKNVAALIKPYLPKHGAGGENKAGPANGTSKGMANGVSPLTRGSGDVAPIPVPLSMTEARNGKPKSRQDLIKETLYEMGLANGKPITLQDIGARMRGESLR